jgi:hypothetical protein
MPWTFYNASGQKLSSAATNISVLDIDGATDIGAAIVDADLFIIDDGAGGTNRKTAASRLKTYAGTTQAVQSDIEAETNQDTYVPPDLMKYHPGVAKAWCQYDNLGTFTTLVTYNCALTDTDVGLCTVAFGDNMSSINYVSQGSNNLDLWYVSSIPLAASLRVQFKQVSDQALTDSNINEASFFGTQV